MAHTTVAYHGFEHNGTSKADVAPCGYMWDGMGWDGWDDDVILMSGEISSLSIAIFAG